MSNISFCVFLTLIQLVYGNRENWAEIVSSFMGTGGIGLKLSHCLSKHHWAQIVSFMATTLGSNCLIIYGNSIGLKLFHLWEQHWTQIVSLFMETALG